MMPPSAAPMLGCPPEVNHSERAAVMPLSFPQSPADLADASWLEIAAFYDALASDGPTPETARAWLRVRWLAD